MMTSSMKVIAFLVAVGVLLFTCTYYLIEVVEDEDRGAVVVSEVEENVKEELETDPGATSEDHFEVHPVDEESSVFDEFQEISSHVYDEYTELDDGGYYNFQVDRIVSPVVNALHHTVSNNIPIIIWWTPFTGDAAGKLKKCHKGGECFITTDRSLQHHTSTTAFLFYGTDFNVSDLPVPRHRDHEWGLLHEESPKNNPVFLYDGVMDVFNHTSTFRKESHFPLTTQYIISESYLLNPLKYSYQQKQQLQQKEELASAVYIQSGCNPPSDRDAYIAELQKFIHIDCYGECLHNKDLPPEYRDTSTMFSRGFMDILQKYKFIVAFENGICDDYITEKLYRSLFLGAVPIFKGAPNVRQWLPSNHSAIIVDDFQSPQELAEYIKYVDTSEDEYEKYRAYKHEGLSNLHLKKTLEQRNWGVDTPYKMNYITGFECHVCDQIHANRVAGGGGRVGSWEHYGCGRPQKYKLPPAPGYEGWEWDVWEWEYQQAAEKVRHLDEALR